MREVKNVETKIQWNFLSQKFEWNVCFLDRHSNLVALHQEKVLDDDYGLGLALLCHWWYLSESRQKTTLHKKPQRLNDKQKNLNIFKYSQINNYVVESFYRNQE